MKIKPTHYQVQIKIFVIKNNMHIIGMSREKYFELLQKV
jgi:hypothetical protein